MRHFKERKKVLFTVFALTVILSLTVESYAIKTFEFTSVRDVVNKVKKRFSSLETYQADFKILTEKAGNKSNKNGKIYYKLSNRMLVEFLNPQGQKIVSDGKNMWIYIPSMNVVAQQDLKSDSDSLFPTTSQSGLQRLFSKYHYKFSSSKKQPEMQPDGSLQYTLFLKQKESRSGLRTIKLWISEDYLIKRAFAESSTGKSIEINFLNVKTNIELPNAMFQFDIPSQARIIKNPMISEE